MKIRRTFKNRKYQKGGTLPKYQLGGTSDCKTGFVKDASGNCVPEGTGTVLRTPPVSSELQGVPDFISDYGQYPNTQDTQSKTVGITNPQIEEGRDGQGTESDFDRITREADEMEEASRLDTTGIDSFSAELAAQNKADDAAMVDPAEQAYNDFQSKPMQDPVTNQQQSTLFNPYAGVDIPTAAYLAGEGWSKGGDKKTAIAATGKFLLGSARNFFSGMGAGNRNAQQMEEFNRKRRQSQIGESTFLGRDGGVIKEDIDALFEGIDLPNMQDGGEVDIDLLTGSYAKGTNNGDENVELEDGEYLQEPGGTPKKVEGKSHEQSDENGTGEKMKLEGGTEVVSDDLKPNKTQRKEIADTFGIKIKAKDTYAKALEKYNKTIGLYDLIEEEEEIIEEIKNQKEKMAEDGADEATSNINLEFLSSKIKDIGDQKVELEALSKDAFNSIFKMQEASKPAEEKDMEQKEFAIGGKVYNQDQIMSVANKYGISKDKAMGIVKKMADGGPVKDRREDLIAQARSLGYEGDLSPENIEQNIGTIQKFLAEKKPQEVINYFKNSGIAITAKGVDILKSKNPEIFKDLKFDINKPSASFTETERKAIQEAAKERGATDDAFYLNQFQDNKWEYRFPIVGVNAPEPAKINTDLGYKEPVVQDLSKQLQNRTQELQNEIVDPNKKEELTPVMDPELQKQADEKAKAAMNVMFLPENMPLPPQGLQMPLKITRRYGDIDLQAVSPDQRLAELNRSVDAAMEQLEGLPSGQKEAAILKLKGNQQAQQDKIVESYNVQENQLNQAEESFNVRQRDRGEDARAIDALDYERRAFGAMANTEDDFRRFFNTAQERNIQNFNTINSLNLLNQASDNFDFGNQGVEFTGGANQSFSDLLASGKFDQAVRGSRTAGLSEEAKKAKEIAEAKASAKPKKRRGGRIKRKY